MPTAVIIIGNSDDKLTQREWSQYVTDVTEFLTHDVVDVHFLGYSPSPAPWQNACWVVEISEESWLLAAKSGLRRIASVHRQDSIALIVGETEFLNG